MLVVVELLVEELVMIDVLDDLLLDVVVELDVGDTVAIPIVLVMTLLVEELVMTEVLEDTLLLDNVLELDVDVIVEELTVEELTTLGVLDDMEESIVDVVD